MRRSAVSQGGADVDGGGLIVPYARAVEWPGALERVRDAGFMLVALTPRQPSVSLRAFATLESSAPVRARGRRIALIVGTEGHGVSAAVEEIADARVRIPMSDAVDSLNLSVAAGIALWELRGGEDGDGA